MSEIDSMNNLIDSYINEINNLQEQLKQLKAENEELKKQVRFKNQFRDYAHKYKQCLDEIEKIVSKGIKIHDDIRVNKQILQLINQVKEGGE